MLGKTSAFLALYVIACIISMTSTAARSRHQRHQLRGEGRTRGRHRNNDDDDNNNNNNNNNQRHGSSNHGDYRHHNRSSPFRHDKNNNDDNTDDDDLGIYYARERKVDGITVPSLHAMQTFGLISSSSSSSSSPSSPSSSPSSATKRKERRPIRGSRKAVVVTKKTYLKKEWCKTQPLKQVVRMRGCLRTKILNNFCYGQCNSFFIPKKARRSKDSEAFLSCGFCRPRRFRWILVTLRCPGKNGMRYKRKRVQYIKKCRCMAQEVTMPPMS